MSSSEPAFGPAAATSLYAASLSAAASVISRATMDATVARRMALGRELQGWLARLPAPFPRTLSTVRPEDLLVFFESHWVPTHAGSSAPGLDHRVASPQGVSSAISHLATLFESLGRRGPYDRDTGQGNPCNCVEMRNYKQGYARTLWQAGYQERSAVPISLDKVTSLSSHLIRHVAALGPQAPALERLETLRDLCLVLYAWHSAMRGTEGGRLSLADLHDSQRRPLFPSGYDPSVPVPTDLWVLPGHGTKTNKRGRNHQDPVHLPAQASLSDKHLCFVTWLWFFLDQSHKTGQTVQHYIFRPLSPSWAAFQEQAYSCTSFAKMIKARLTAIGLYSGETTHSFRRGTLQATNAQAGILAAAVQGRIKTPQILNKYLDTQRRTRGS